jgi:hypothetical protein
MRSRACGKDLAMLLQRLGRLFCVAATASGGAALRRPRPALSLEPLEDRLAPATLGVPVAWGADVDGQTNVPAGLSKVVAIAAGGIHSLALKSDSTVAAWGDDNFGESDVPAGLGNVVAISAGSFHSLALKSDGTVVAWGADGAGQTNVPAGLGNVVAIAAGDSHSLALPQSADVLSAKGGDSQSAGIGRTFGAPLLVRLVDASGHPVANGLVAFAAPTSGAGGTFARGSSTALVRTDANGFATAPAFTANGIAGGYQVSASAGAATTSFTLSNTPGPASKLAFVNVPSAATAGQPLSFQVDVEDSFGNLVPTDSSTVTVSASGPGTFTSGQSSVQAQHGVATFTDLMLKQLGGYSLTASDGSLTQATSSSFPLTFSDTFPQTLNKGLSAAWTLQAGTFTVQNQAAAGSGPIDLATVNAVLPQSDADLSADVRVSAVGQEAGLVARWSGPGDQNDYSGELSDTASGFVASLVRNVNGVRTTLASQSVAPGSGRLRLVVSGSALELFFNTILVASANDVTFASAGGVGMRATAGATLDNFTAAAALAFSPPPGDQTVVYTPPGAEQVSVTVSNPDNANLTWTASAVPAAAVVLQRYGLTAVNGNGVAGPGPVDLFQGLFGAGADWLLSNNNSNPMHNNWFHLFPDGTVRAWNGSSDPKVIATEQVLTTLDPSYYANPVIQFGLATLADPTAKAAATSVVNKYDLIYNGTTGSHGLYYQDLFGVDWLFSANGSNAANGGWYQLFPDGTLRAWNGTSNVSSEAVLGQVSPMLYQDPDLLVTLPFAQTAYTTQQTLALTGPISNYQNAYGQNEIWFHSANGSNSAHGGYYQLLPDGTLHAWNGLVKANISAEPLVATLGTGATSPDTSYWYNPSLLVNALPQAGPPSGVSAADTTANPSPATSASIVIGYPNYTGEFGVSVNVSDGFLTLTKSFLVTVTDPPSTVFLTTLNGKAAPAAPILPTETVVHTNVTGSALFVDVFQTMGALSPQVVTGTYAVDEALGLIFKGDYAPNLFGYNARWLYSSNGGNAANLGWYNLFADGTIRPWSGSSDPSTIASQPIVATLDASLWSNPDLLATGDAAQASWNLEQAIDLTGPGMFQNAYGFGEKWLQSGNGHNAANGGWYQLTPDGVVHQWDGGRDIATEAVVGRLNGSYWYNPSLITSLFGAPQPAQPPSGITATVGGTSSNPAVALSGATSFVGTFGVSTSFTDAPFGTVTVTADFLVQTTDAPLTLANPGAQTAHVSGSPQLQVTLGGHDPDSPAAALTYQAAVFTSLLDAQAFAVTQALGLTFAASYYQNSLGANEKWLHSSNGNNAAHDGWYLLLPNGDLRLYDGTASGPLVASFSTGAGNSTYWNDPSTLLQPTPVAGIITGISGNVATFFGFTHTQINMSFYAAALVGDGVATAWTLFAIEVQL